MSFNKVNSMELIYYRAITVRLSIIKYPNAKQESEFKIVVLLLWKIHSSKIKVLESSAIQQGIFNVGLWLSSISSIKIKMVEFMYKATETKHNYLTMSCTITIKWESEYKKVHHHTFY